MNKIYILLTFCFVWLSALQVSAQQLSFQLAPSSITAAVGDQIDVEVRVGNGFTDILSLQYGVNYNGAALEYVGVTSVLLNGYDVQKRPNKSELVNVWLDQTFQGETLDPGTVLYVLQFNVISDIGNSVDIICDEGEVLCEFSFSNLQKFNDIIVDQTADINGGGPAQNVGPINFTLSNETAATGSQSCVQFAVSDFVDILSMQFSVQYDETVLSYSGILQDNFPCQAGQPAPAENPLCIEGGNFNDFQPGTLTFSFADFTNGSAFTLPDGTVIFDLCFDVIGAGGTSSDIIIDGDPTFIQVIKQGEGAENFGLNSTVGSVTVDGTGGALDVVTYTVGTASGDNGTNVCVPVTVNDGFDDITGFGWSIEYDNSIINYTGVQNVNPAISTMAVNSSMPSSVGFLWDTGLTQNGEVTLPDETVLYEMCFDVVGASGQVSPLEFSDSPILTETVKVDGPDMDTEQDNTIVETNNGSVSVSNSDGFNLIICNADACPSDQVCVPFLATGAVDISAVQLNITYDPAVLSFDEFAVAQGLSNFQVNEISPGSLIFIYFDLFGSSVLNLQDCEPMGEFCFDVIGAQGTASDVAISNVSVNAVISGTITEIPAGVTDGTVAIDCGGTPGAPVIDCVCGPMTDPLTIDEDATIINDVACFEENTGSIELALTGGLAPFSIDWDNGSDQLNLVNITADTYCVTITDANGDQATGCFDVLEPASALDASAVLTPQSLPGTNDGAIVLSATGGTAPYTYSWNGPNTNNVTTKDLSNLDEGNYVVVVTDANGCELTRTFVVETAGSALAVDSGATQVASVSCFGENDGAINPAVSGGTTPYTYSWTGPNGFSSTSANISGLAPGNYQLTVTDNAGATAESVVFAITQPSAPLSATGQITDESSAGQNDGGIDLTVSGGTPGYSFTWSNNIFVEDNFGLAAGNYTVTITDARGCTFVESFTVGAGSLAINDQATVINDVNCFGESNGAINTFISGGVTPYTFNWSGPNNFVGTTSNISGLVAGTYQMTVTDATGAMVVSIPYVISQPNSAVDASAQIVEESSPGQNDGSIDLTITGGTPGYNVSWSNGAFTEDISGLAAGAYTATITDARGCSIIETYSVPSLADPLTIDAQASVVNGVRCFGEQNGSISPVINGGTLPYSFDWGFSTDRDISGLTAGTYTLTVTDQFGLMDIQTFLVQSPLQLDVQTIAIPESANGNDGAIQTTVNGGTPNYTFVWSGPNGFSSSSEDITGLEEGTYTLLVIDANGCQEQTVVNLGAILSIENKFEIDVDCVGECTGEIDIVVSGGQPPYLYTWNGPDNFSATTQDIDDLCAGIYAITITDAEGQQVLSTCRIDEPLIALSIANNPTIINEVVPNQGSINITVNGGTPPYSYQWSNQATSEDIIDLEAGSYRVTVTDANGCIVISEDYIIERIPTEPNIENLVINNPTCNGDCDGSVSFQIVGGDAPYTVTWNDLGSQTLSTANPTFIREDMCADDYVLTIMDANGQTIEQAITLEDLPAIVIEGVVTNEMNGNDGTINTTVTGGQAPFSYDWAPSNLPDTPDQENLSAGLFIVTVTDANECTAIASFVVEDNIGPLNVDPATVVINGIDCFGDMNGSIDITVTGGVQPYNFLWSPSGQTTEDAIGLGAGEHTVTVTDGRGDQFEGTYTIVAPEEIVAEVNIRTSTTNMDECDGIAEIVNLAGGQAPYTFLWSPSQETTEIALKLCAGPQSVLITDALGCSITIDFDTEGGTGIALGAAIGEMNVNCNGDATGSLSVNAFGGRAPYEYIWSTGETTPNIGNLLPGFYSVTIIDTDGTEIVFEDLEITEPDPIVNNFNIVEESGMGTGDGSAEIVTTGGCAPYTYQWNNPGNCQTALCENLIANTYFVVVQDAKECIQVDSVVVSNAFGGECNMTRNIITPDQDGKNDSFIIQCAPGTINTLEIYNRWGQLVFLADNYDNTWEGTDRRGQALPDGGYFYVFLLEDAATGETVPFQGHITILRE